MDTEGEKSPLGKRPRDEGEREQDAPQTTPSVPKKARYVTPPEATCNAEEQPLFILDFGPKHNDATPPSPPSSVPDPAPRSPVRVKPSVPPPQGSQVDQPKVREPSRSEERRETESTPWVDPRVIEQLRDKKGKLLSYSQKSKSDPIPITFEYSVRIRIGSSVVNSHCQATPIEESSSSEMWWSAPKDAEQTLSAAILSQLPQIANQLGLYAPVVQELFSKSELQVEEKSPKNPQLHMQPLPTTTPVVPAPTNTMATQTQLQTAQSSTLAIESSSGSLGDPLLDALIKDSSKSYRFHKDAVLGDLKNLFMRMKLPCQVTAKRERLGLRVEVTFEGGKIFYTRHLAKRTSQKEAMKEGAGVALSHLKELAEFVRARYTFPVLVENHFYPKNAHPLAEYFHPIPRGYEEPASGQDTPEDCVNKIVPLVSRDLCTLLNSGVDGRIYIGVHPNQRTVCSLPKVSVSRLKRKLFSELAQWTPRPGSDEWKWDLIPVYTNQHIAMADHYDDIVAIQQKIKKADDSHVPWEMSAFIELASIASNCVICLSVSGKRSSKRTFTAPELAPVLSPPNNTPNLQSSTGLLPKLEPKNRNMQYNSR